MGNLFKALKTTFVALIAAFTISGVSLAAPSISFDTADNSSFPVGSTPVVTGNAGGTSGGIDLAIVLDSSGSMGGSLTIAQREAAIALVNSLPTGTRVTIVEFDSDANVVQSLITISDQTSLDLLTAAITSVNAAGGTDIRDGINVASAELLANTDPDRAQQIILLSDGNSDQAEAVGAATAAVNGGINSITTVGLPGTNTVLMQAVATAGNGTFIDVSSDVSQLAGIFTGQGGNLVGITSIEVVMPDGTVITLAVNGLGDFELPAWVLAQGDNTFTVNVVFNDNGTSVSLSEQITLVGATTATSEVPLPAAAWFMGAGLAAFGASRRKKKAA